MLRFNAIFYNIFNDHNNCGIGIYVYDLIKNPQPIRETGNPPRTIGYEVQESKSSSAQGA